MKRVMKFLLNSCFYLVLVLLCVIVFQTVTAKQQGVVPQYFGYRMFNVLTGSMEPTIPTGSLIVDKVIEPTSLTVGDVVTFKGVNSNLVTTHRIVEIDDLCYVTKGDANAINDPQCLTNEQVLGKVVLTIPMLGALFQWAQTNVVVIIICVLIVTVGYSLIRKKLRQ